MRYARAERQRIHMVIQRENLPAHALCAFAVGKVAAHGVRIITLCAKAVCQRFCVVYAVAAVNQNGISLLREQLGAGAANAAGSAGDQRDLLFHQKQFLRRFSLPLDGSAVSGYHALL